MKHTLVIIDMQARYPASADIHVQQACVREIKRAKKAGDAIIFLTYRGDGPTLPVLLSAARGYKRVSHMTKDNDGGGDRIYQSVNRRGFPADFIVCGVNTAACVRETVYELHDLYPKSKIRVVSDAVNGSPDNPPYYNTAEYWFQGRNCVRNVLVLKRKPEPIAA